MTVAYNFPCRLRCVTTDLWYSVATGHSDHFWCWCLGTGDVSHKIPMKAALEKAVTDMLKSTKMFLVHCIMSSPFTIPSTAHVSVTFCPCDAYSINLWSQFTEHFLVLTHCYMASSNDTLSPVWLILHSNNSEKRFFFLFDCLAFVFFHSSIITRWLLGRWVGPVMLCGPQILLP